MNKTYKMVLIDEDTGEKAELRISKTILFNMLYTDLIKTALGELAFDLLELLNQEDTPEEVKENG